MDRAEHPTANADPEPSPVASGERLDALDLMRGVAVLGILAANITAFAHVSLAYYWPPALPGGATTADALVWLAQFVLVDGKFRGLFSILFGAGMVLFVERIADYERAVWLQARRLFWLALFGLAHFYLLFVGDILFSYACAGLVALIALPLAARTQLTLGIFCAGLGGALRLLDFYPGAALEMGGGLASADPAHAALFAQFWQERVARAMAEAPVMLGGLGDIVRYRFAEQSGILFGGFTISLYETVPLMIIGMGLMRAGLFAPEARLGRWHLPAILAVATGLAVNFAAGLHVWRLGFPPFTTQLTFFGISMLANLPILVGGSVLFARWASRPHRGWLGQRLIAAGRTAFSNYVGTSLVMALIFQGWGLGLFGSLHRLALLPFVLLGWALMLAWPKPWLALFRQGPLEYLWRCITYMEIFRFRR